MDPDRIWAAPSGGTGSSWQPGAGGLCLHTIVQHPTDPQRLFTAISAAGVPHRRWWRHLAAHQQGPALRRDPDQDAEVGHCVHDVDDPLPDAVLSDKEPFLVIGAMAGG